MNKTKLKKWKLLKEEDVSPSKWFPLYKHEVELSSGKIVTDYYISKLGDVSMIVPITKDKKIVFVRQYKHGVGDIILELPAGRVGENTFEKAAELELKEETGYIATELEPLGSFSHTPSKDTTTIKGFLCRNLENQDIQELDDNEEIEVVEIPVTEVEKMIVEGKIFVPDTIAFIYLARLHAPELFK